MLFIFSLLLCPCDANEKYLELKNRCIDEKIYLSPHELLVTDCGLFLLTRDTALPLTAIFSDANGIYINFPVEAAGQMKAYTCPNGHDIYHRECGGCANWWCNFRCKCYSPWP